MPIKPLRNRVVIRQALGETRVGSLIIPDASAEKPNRGKVIAVGPGKKNLNGEFQSLTVKVGEEVLFIENSGHRINVLGDELLVISEDDIIGVVEPE